MKNLLDKCINKLGYNVTKNVARPRENPFNVLEIILSKYIQCQPGFFFIQIGANDGVRWDPLHKFICEHDLQGVLVEPLPDLFKDLKENYNDCTKLHFENCAISNCDGTGIIYRAKRGAPVEDWVHGIASFDKLHVSSRVPQEWLVSEQVDTRTPKSLLEKYKVDHIDLLQIDTEGFDFEIIKMFIAAGNLPKIINYENVHLSSQEKVECKNLLYENGYSYLDVGIDVLAVHNSASKCMYG